MPSKTQRATQEAINKTKEVIWKYYKGELKKY